jgi:hypothetical protein
MAFLMPNTSSVRRGTRVPLDAVLKAVIYNKDGSISDVTEAIAVTPGEPTKELSALSKDK